MQKFDFRFFLKREFKQRQDKNPRYSLRAYAKDIGLSSQMLNSVFNHDAGLSRSKALQVMKKINLTEGEQELFLALVEASHQRSSMGRKAAREKLEQIWQRNIAFEKLGVAEFKTIANWKEVAALCLVDVEDFKTDYKWLGQRLSISPDEAEKIYERLFQLGMLRIEDTKWVRDSAKFSVTSEQSSEVMRNYHRDLLKKAEGTIDGTATDKRHMANVIFSLNREDYDFAKQEIENFRHNLLSQIAARGGKSDRVYAVTIECFPLDQEMGRL